jgi:hypothetical protein
MVSSRPAPQHAVQISSWIAGQNRLALAVLQMAQGTYSLDNTRGNGIACPTRL